MSRIRQRRSLFESMEPRLLLTAELVSDINPLPVEWNGDYFAEVNDVLLFTIDHPVLGKEIWRTDGWSDRTAMLADINSGLDGSDPELIHVFDDVVVFAATSDETGRELWRTDGTVDGTTLIKDIHEGFRESSHPEFLTVIDDQIVFMANDGQRGDELWRTDGTFEGTGLVKELFNNNSVHPEHFFDAGDSYFFKARDTGTGNEIWRTDGTDDGTFLLKDINPNNDSSSAEFLTYINETLVFQATDAVRRGELWYSDGTLEGTQVLKEIIPGDDYERSLVPFATLPGITIFEADDNRHGNELWRTDGTAAGTKLIKDIRSDGSLSPNYITTIGDVVIFEANDGEHGSELWRTDGTEEGTFLLRDIAEHDRSSRPAFIGVIDDVVIFSAQESASDRQLWRTDGTTVGTYRLVDLERFPSIRLIEHTATSDEYVFFSARTRAHGEELWRTDGTIDGTTMLVDARSGDESSRPEFELAFDNRILFSVTNSHAERELWSTDGTEDGTIPLISADPGHSVSGIRIVGATAGQTLLETGRYSQRGQFWLTDGRVEGTKRIRDLDIDGYTDVKLVGDYQDFVVFAIEANGKWDLWQVNVVNAQLTPLGEFQGLGTYRDFSSQAILDRLVFVADDGRGDELWSVGANGELKASNIFPGTTGSFPRSLASTEDTLHFVARTGDGNHLFKLQGEELTQRVFDDHVAFGDAVESSVVHQGQLYFLSIEGRGLYRMSGDADVEKIAHVDGLGRFDNTSTILLADNRIFFAAGVDSLQTIWSYEPALARPPQMEFQTSSFEGIDEIVAIGNQVVIRVDRQLYATDGTSFNGRQIPFPEEQFHSELTHHFVLDEKLFVIMRDETRFPAETFLWSYDGINVAWEELDLASVKSNIAILNDEAFFVANDGYLWKTNGDAQGTQRVVRLGTTDATIKIVDGELLVAMGSQLFASDGTAVGTERLHDFRREGEIQDFVNLDGQVFVAVRNALATNIWKYEPDQETASKVSQSEFIDDAQQSTTTLTVFDGEIYFLKLRPGFIQGPLSEIWRIEKDSNTATLAIDAGFSGMKVFESHLLLKASRQNPSALYVSDGTQLNTTIVNNGVERVNSIQDVVPLNDGVLFLGHHEQFGNELFFADDSGLQLVHEFVPGPVSSFFQNANIVAAHDQAYFLLQRDKRVELWKTDGTETVQLTTVAAFDDDEIVYAFSSRIVEFQSGIALSFAVDIGHRGRHQTLLKSIISDGTPSGTSVIQQSTIDNFSHRALNVAASGAELYFVVADDFRDFRLQRFDANSNAVTQVADISFNPTTIVNGGRQLFFARGNQLFVIDGATLVSFQLAEGQIDSSTLTYSAATDTLFFTARRANHGSELYSFKDGEFTLMDDIAPGPQSASPSDLLVVGSALYFSANDPRLGRELFVLVGAGIPQLVADVLPGNVGSNPRDLTRVGDNLYFTAVDEDHGRELWRVDLRDTIQTLTGTLTGKVFIDANLSLTRDSVERGLANQEVFLDADNDGEFDLNEPLTTTDSDGRYAFSNIAPGSYAVRSLLDEGWASTTNVAQVTIGESTPQIHVDIGVFFEEPWAVSEHSNNTEASLDDQYSKVAIAPNGDIIAVGTYHAKGDSGNHPSDGAIIVSAYRQDGRLLWRRVFGSPDDADENSADGDDRALDVAVDSRGRIYVIGAFHHQIDFDPLWDHADHRDVVESQNAFDVFLLKLDADGNFVAVNAYGGGTLTWDIGWSIAIDNQDRLYMAGRLGGHRSDFDPANEYADDRDIYSTNRRGDSFAARFNASGRLDWLRLFGGTGFGWNAATAIAVDNAGFTYVTGTFANNADFDSAQEYDDNRDIRLTRGDRPDDSDGFVLTLTDDGQFVGVETFGGIGWQSGYGIAANGEQVVVAGVYQATTTFGDDGASLNAQGKSDGFVASMDDGEFRFVRNLNATREARATDVALAGNGDIIVSGHYRGGLGLDFLEQPIIADGESDGFVYRFRANGRLNAVGRITGSGEDWAVGIAIDPAQNVYVAGAFSEQARFISSGQRHEVNHHAAADAFLWRTPLTTGDFDFDGTIGVDDVDRMCIGIRSNDSLYDYNGDGRNSIEDVVKLLSRMGSGPGDANVDGAFDSEDLIQIFQRGHYHDGIPNGSLWSDGDWNCDGQFDSRDLVFALQNDLLTYARE